MSGSGTAYTGARAGRQNRGKGDKLIIRLERFGLTTKGSIKSLADAAAITAAGLLAVFLVGYMVGFKAAGYDTAWIIYYIVLSVPVQEIIFRGILQTELYRFGKLRAVAISSIIFAAAHFASPLLVVLTFPAGLAWGYSFSRRGTLIGPMISHAILGLAIFIFVTSPPF